MHDLGGDGGGGGGCGADIVRIRIANSFSPLLSTSLLIRVRQGFREHEDPKRLQLEGGPEGRAPGGRSGGRCAQKNPRRLFVTRSAVLFGLELRGTCTRSMSAAQRAVRTRCRIMVGFGW